MPLICFLFSPFGPWEKKNYDFLSVKFSVGYCAVYNPVSYWDVENSKDQSWSSFS